MQKFERYEFKYVIPEFICHELEKNLSNFMELDNFSKKQKKKSYFVRSLYFENDINENFFEKIDGIKYREKYRFRTYQKEFSKNIFLEKKMKNNERVFKDRVSISKKEYEFIINGNYSKFANKKKDNKFFLDFFHKVLKNNEYPKIIIDYNRRPYVSDHDKYFRISIDGDLIARDINLTKVVECIPGYKIMEVKFFRRIPLWFHRLIQTYSLKRVSISKFVVGMKKMEYTVDLS